MREGKFPAGMGWIMVAWDFSLAGGNPPFKVAALGVDFQGVEFRAAEESAG